MPAPYSLDLTGQAPANLVVAESHAISDIVSNDTKIVIPIYGPFFTYNFELRLIHSGGPTVLQEDVHYSFAFPYIAATRSIGENLYGGLIINDQGLNGTLEIDYQTLGGDHIVDRNYVLAQLVNAAYNPRLVYWDVITNAPAAFAPEPHEQDFDSFAGYDALLAELVAIRDAIANNALDLQAALQDFFDNNVIGAPSNPSVGFDPNFSSGVSAVSELPVGTIIDVYDGDTVPPQSVRLDGVMRLITNYPKLFEHLRHRHLPLSSGHQTLDGESEYRPNNGKDSQYYDNRNLFDSELETATLTQDFASGVSLGELLDGASVFTSFEDRNNPTTNSFINVLGGYNGSAYVDEIRTRSISSSTGLVGGNFTLSGDTLVTPRGHLASLHYGDTGLRIDIGGITTNPSTLDPELLDRVDVIYPGATPDETLTPLPVPLSHMSAFLWRGDLYVVGGREEIDGNGRSNVYKLPLTYDGTNLTDSGEWEDVFSTGFIGGRCHSLHSFVYGDRVFLMGGYHNSDVRSAFFFQVINGQIDQQEVFDALPEVTGTPNTALRNAVYVLIGRVLYIFGNFPTSVSSFNVYRRAMSNTAPYGMLPMSSIVSGASNVALVVNRNFENSKATLTNKKLYLIGHAANRGQVSPFTYSSHLCGLRRFGFESHNVERPIDDRYVMDVGSSKAHIHQFLFNTPVGSPFSGEPEWIDDGYVTNFGFPDGALSLVRGSQVYLFPTTVLREDLELQTNFVPIPSDVYVANIDPAGEVEPTFTGRYIVNGYLGDLDTRLSDLLSIGNSAFLFHSTNLASQRARALYMEFVNDPDATDDTTIKNINFDVPDPDGIVTSEENPSYRATSYKENVYVLTETALGVTLQRASLEDNPSLVGANWFKLPFNMPIDKLSKENKTLMVIGQRLCLFVVGRLTPSDPYSVMLYKTTINNEYGIGSWEVIPNIIPYDLEVVAGGHFPIVTTRSKIYILGWVNSQESIYSADLNEGGDIVSAFTRNNNIAINSNRRDFAHFITDGRLYRIGGKGSLTGETEFEAARKMEYVQFTGGADDYLQYSLGQQLLPVTPQLRDVIVNANPETNLTELMFDDGLVTYENGVPDDINENIDDDSGATGDGGDNIDIAEDQTS